MWGALFILFFIILEIFGSGVIAIPILIYVYRKGTKDEREHPEKYKNRKRDNGCYWID